MILRWDKDIYFYNEINPDIIKQYFLNDERAYEDDMKKADELLEMEAELIIQNKSSFSAETLNEKFNLYMIGDNFIYLYEFLNILYLIIKKNDLENLLQFFNNMDTNIKSIFYSILFTCGYNAYIVKIYTIFICRLRTLVNSNNVCINNFIL